METNKQSLSGLKKEDFKKVINGKEVDLFVLTNANGMEVQRSLPFFEQSRRLLPEAVQG